MGRGAEAGGGVGRANGPWRGPYWSLGGEVVKDGKLSFDRQKAEAGLAMWRRMVSDGVAKSNVSEVGTDDTRKEMQAGRVIFGVNWGYAWNHLQKGADTQVSGKIGVAQLPAMPWPCHVPEPAFRDSRPRPSARCPPDATLTQTPPFGATLPCTFAPAPP